MIGNKRVLVVVPARGGSKGVKLKNLKTIGGIPLVALVGKIVAEMKISDRAIVSTDHEEITRVAINSGLEAPFLRPEHLSGDRIGDVDVLTHALIEIENIDGVKYDIIVMLQPTSPSRKVMHVIGAIQKLIDTNADSVWTVSLSDTKAHPYKQLIISDDEIAFYDEKGASIIARQELFPTYHKNGIAYVITRDCLLNRKSIKGEKCVPFIIDEHVSNIDTELDIAFAEFLLNYKNLAS